MFRCALLRSMMRLRCMLFWWRRLFVHRRGGWYWSAWRGFGMLARSLLGGRMLIWSCTRTTIATRTSLHSSQSTLFRCVNWRWRRSGRVRRQWPPLDGRAFAWTADCRASSRPCALQLLLWWGLLLLRTCIVICELNTNLAGVLAPAIEAVPGVALAAAGDNDGLEAHPSLTNQFGLLVVVEYRYFQLVVVGGIVHGKA